jgi:hypothetical protein
MKKFILLILFCCQIAFSQIIHVGYFPFTNPKVYLRTELNQPGFLQTGNFTNAPSVGTVFKSDGAYFQTFTNHPLNLAVNNGSPALQINTSGNVRIYNYSEIDVLNANLIIKQALYTGLTDNYDPSNPLNTNDGLPNETRIAHGLNATKIISIGLICNVSPGFDIPEEFQAYSGNQLSISYDNTFIHVWNYPNNSNFVRNKPFKFLITYKK